MASELTGELWEGVMKARVMAMAATSTAVIEDGLPRGEDREICRRLVAQDAAVRGNRPMTGTPTWADARLCLAATLRECLAMLAVRSEKGA